MKTQIAKQISTTLILGLFAIPSLAHIGEGRNGPDLQGQAIPRTVDRGITVDELKNATITCIREFAGRGFAI